ncbi:MAG: hypothetical protein AAF226_01780 [Verrucomicrobiota bacterium]
MKRHRKVAASVSEWTRLDFRQNARQGHPSYVSSDRGMALLLVVAVVALLGLIIAGLWTASQSSWEASQLDNGRFEAQLLAESGSNLARHPEIEPGDPVLRQDFGDGRSFEVKVETENGRILVNRISDDFFIEGVTELFVLWGLDATNAAIAAESIADWIDADDEARTNGAENPYYAGLDYPQFPTNESMTSLETLMLVRGMDKVIQIQPNWRSYFTVHSDGILDLNFAKPQVIEAFLKTTSDTAVSFVATRAGDDGELGTEDDYIVEDTDEVQGLLGISDQEWGEISSDVTLTGSMRRIESIGKVGDRYAVKIIVLQNGEGESATPVARLVE